MPDKILPLGPMAHGMGGFDKSAFNLSSKANLEGQLVSLFRQAYDEQARQKIHFPSLLFVLEWP